MKLVNTHISNDCTRRAYVYVDKNGHYEIKRYMLMMRIMQYLPKGYGRTKFKHIESCNRAVDKWIVTHRVSVDKPLL